MTGEIPDNKNKSSEAEIQSEHYKKHIFERPMTLYVAKTNSSTLSNRNTERILTSNYWNTQIANALRYSNGIVKNHTPEEIRTSIRQQHRLHFEYEIDVNPPNWEPITPDKNKQPQSETLTVSDKKDWTPNKVAKGGLFLFTSHMRDSKNKWIPVRIMYDTGASTNYISKEFVKANKFNNLKQSNNAITVRVADGSTYTSNQTLKSILRHEPTGYTSSQQFHVLPLDMEVDIILGYTWQDTLDNGELSSSTHHNALSFTHNGKSYTIETQTQLSSAKTIVEHFEMISRKQADSDIQLWEEHSQLLLDQPPALQIECRHLGIAENDIPTYPTEESTATQNQEGYSFKESDRDQICDLIRNEDEPLIRIMNQIYTMIWPEQANQTNTQQVNKVAHRSTRGSYEEDLKDDPDDQIIDGIQPLIDKILEDYKHIVVETMPKGASSDGIHNRPYKATIRIDPTKGGEIPYKKPYKMSSVQLDQLKIQLDELLEQGYIIPTDSPYGNPIMMVPKPHDREKLRMVADFRPLNERTIRDRYPLPTFEQTIRQLQGSKVFSTLDMYSGFWQIPMHPDDIEKTACTSQFGSYAWVVMPQGLANAPSTFQRYMNSILKDVSSFAKVFIDDILIHSTDCESHDKHLRMVLEKLAEHKMYVKKSKIMLYRKSCKFLGHTLTPDGIKPQYSKIAAIEKWPAPTNVSEVRQFLGLVGYYQNFISAYSAKAKPLFGLLRKGIEFPEKLTTEQQNSFDSLRQALISEPVMIIPDQQKANSAEAPYVVIPDVSGVGIGGVIMQDQGKGLQPIAYESRTLTPAESNYSAGDLELLGLYHCTKVWQHLLHGSHYEVRGDHQPLEHLMRPSRDLTRRQARWITHFMEIGVHKVQYTPGKTIPLVDALSRNPSYKKHTPLEGLQDYLRQNGYTDSPLYVEPIAVHLETQAVIDHQLQTLFNITYMPDEPKYNLNLSTRSQNIHKTDTQLNTGGQDTNVNWLNVESKNFLAALKKAQHKDPYIQKIHDTLSELPHQHNNQFKLSANLIWRVKEGRYQLVVPKQDNNLQQVILEQAHDNPAAGHLGRRKTLERVKRDFWWYKMEEEINIYCASCKICQAVKTTTQPQSTTVSPQDVPIRKWSVVTIDFVTGLPTTKRGNNAIATFTDKLTKMVHLVPLDFENSDASVIAQLYVDNVWKYHGWCTKIISDRDPRFSSNFWKELGRILGIHLALTTPYHPAGNGQSERTNQTMEQILRSYVDPRQNDWDLHLSPCEFSINDSISLTHKFTPFQLNYGQHPITAIDLLTKAITANEPIKVKAVKLYFDEMKDNIQKARQLLVNNNIQMAAKSNKGKKMGKAFEVGDKVLLNSKTFTAPHQRDTKLKLRSRYGGPFVITKVHYSDFNQNNQDAEPSAYTLRLPRSWQIHHTFSRDKLKPFVETNKFPNRQEPPPPDTVEIEGHKEFKVEKILDSKMMRSRGRKNIERHWLVKWTGFGYDHAEWLPLDYINTGGMENSLWKKYEIKNDRLVASCRHKQLVFEDIKPQLKLNLVTKEVQLAYVPKIQKINHLMINFSDDSPLVHAMITESRKLTNQEHHFTTLHKQNHNCDYPTHLTEWESQELHTIYQPTDIQYVWMLLEKGNDVKQQINSFFKVVDDIKPRNWSVLSSQPIDLKHRSMYSIKTEVCLEGIQPLTLNTNMPVEESKEHKGIQATDMNNVAKQLLKYVV